ncbi:putative protein phosphatase 1 regulatory subunit [Blattamonas nauphoetae]|uniref:Uncharacterized protein n=1 Tax=Blattamonas nauphoetae TaxID=2049346 RepID=A0ABQ9XU48_9EUKA|nr:putative protein phosphatase 1 regulatory subunit [Blattamonas nauphoetae]
MFHSVLSSVPIDSDKALFTNNPLHPVTTPSAKIAKPSLHVLGLVNTGIDDDDLQHIVDTVDAPITTLFMKNNSLSTLDPVTRFPQLRVLDASFNKLTTISSNILQIGSLQALILTNNSISSLPRLAHPLINTIVLSHNSLTSVEIGDLPSLTKISVSHNKLSSLPDLSGCPKLCEIRANNNMISTLPDDSILSRLSLRINLIDLSNNVIPLSELDKFRHFKSLLNLGLRGNPLREDSEVSLKLISMLPRLHTLDYTKLSQEEKQKAREIAPEPTKPRRKNKPGKRERDFMKKKTETKEKDESENEDKIPTESQEQPIVKTKRTSSSNDKETEGKKKKKSTNKKENEEIQPHPAPQEDGGMSLADLLQTTKPKRKTNKKAKEEVIEEEKGEVEEEQSEKKEAKKTFRVEATLSLDSIGGWD